VIDFPKGESGIKTKIKEIDKAIINGANEIDVVLNYNMIKNSDEHEDLENEIREITEYCHRESIIVKATIEIGALNYQEIENICKMCVDNNVDFITTSTVKLSRDDSFESKLEKVNDALVEVSKIFLSLLIDLYILSKRVLRLVCSIFK
jgi:deoxyribose-phosphate aldolase